MIGRGGNKVKEKLALCVWGNYGSGKSWFCSEALKLKREDGKPMRVLYIDPEQGSIDSFLNRFQDEGVDTRNVYIAYTADKQEVIDLIKRAAEGGEFYEFDEEGNEDITKVYKDADGNKFNPDFIVVDGTTVLRQSGELARLAFSEKRAAVRAEAKQLTGAQKSVAIEGADLEVKDYKQLAFDGRLLIRELLASGKHFAVTARAKEEKEYKTVDGKQVIINTGREVLDGYKEIQYDVKTVIHMVEEKGDFGSTYYGVIDNKDRTLVHNRGDKIENISLLDWQPVIDRGVGLADIKVANDIKDAVEKEAARLVAEANKNSKVDGMKDGVPTVTLEELKVQVKAAIAKLPTSEEKKALKAKATEQGLSTAIDGYTSIEELQKLYDLIPR